MNFIEYRPLALRTAKPLPGRQQVLHAAIGLLTEVGELADAYKRHFIYGKPLDAINTAEETADVCWYLNLLADCVGISGEEMQNFYVISLTDSEVEKQFTADTPEFEKACTRLATAGMVACVTLIADSEALESGELRSIMLEAIPELLAVLSKLCMHGTVLDALDRNIAKLALRYGDKYTDYAALNRDHAAERTVLEGGGEAVQG